jgi:hypothetical protein
MTALVRWRKSSRSTNTGTCVELAHTLDALRDSKNPTGPHLSVDVGALLDIVKAGGLDR